MFTTLTVGEVYDQRSLPLSLLTTEVSFSKTPNLKQLRVCVFIKETAVTVVDHVFHIHMDVVSKIK